MNTVNRRYFIMSSVALPVALKASALPSQNNTVRVAVVGFNGRNFAVYAPWGLATVACYTRCQAVNRERNSGSRFT